MVLIIRIRSVILAIAGALDWFPPLLARFTVGVVFVISGWGKLHTIPDVIEFFRSLGIPAPTFQAYLVANTELFCGLAVLVGLLTRLASIPLIITMIVAILTAKREDMESWDDLLAFSEYLYICLLAWLAVAGAGKLSLDRLLARKLLKETGRS